VEVDISYILSGLVDGGFSVTCRVFFFFFEEEEEEEEDMQRWVTFNYTLASIAETVPIRRVPDGLESFIDRLALS
jgi:hypothetical protein